MTQFQVVGLYAALNALVMLWLAANVGRVRGRTKISLGDGGNEEMLRAMRAHANNTEYVPIALILFTLLAAMQASTLLLHILGIALLIGRIFHGIGLSRSSNSVGRGIGASLTFLSILVAILFLLFYTVRPLFLN